MPGYPRSRDWPLSAEQHPPLGAIAIKLNQRWVAWVDVADQPLVAGYTWHVHKAKGRDLRYAQTNIAVADGRRRRQRTVQMHRLILGVKGQIDHIEHREKDRVVDNRRSNIRPCTNRQNSFNQRKLRTREAASIFKGVTWSRYAWQARIRLNDRHSISLGFYREEAHAALAYDLRAVKERGDYALTNFPVPGSTNWIYGPEQ
jgi:hypothetical protein